MSGHASHGRGAPDVPVGAAAWDERYRGSARVWSGRPNPVLVAEAADLAPGTALDVGAGEGADAVWLARRGWAVTALDVSAVALERAAGHAADAGDDVARRITWRRADATTDPVGGPYDLVSAQFMHLPGREEQGALHRALAAAVAPGGTLLVVLHAVRDLAVTAHRPPPDLFTPLHRVRAVVDGPVWEVLVAQERPREPVEVDGAPVVLHDVVVRARRRE